MDTGLCLGSFRIKVKSSESLSTDESKDFNCLGTQVISAVKETASQLGTCEISGNVTGATGCSMAMGKSVASYTSGSISHSTTNASTPGCSNNSDLGHASGQSNFTASYPDCFNKSAGCFNKSAECFYKSAECFNKTAECFKKSAECFKKSAECYKKSAESFNKSAECFNKTADCFNKSAGCFNENGHGGLFSQAIATTSTSSSSKTLGLEEILNHSATAILSHGSDRLNGKSVAAPIPATGGPGGIFGEPATSASISLGSTTNGFGGLASEAASSVTVNFGGSFNQSAATPRGSTTSCGSSGQPITASILGGSFATPLGKPLGQSAGFAHFERFVGLCGFGELRSQSATKAWAPGGTAHSGLGLGGPFVQYRSTSCSINHPTNKSPVSHGPGRKKHLKRKPIQANAKHPPADVSQMIVTAVTCRDTPLSHRFKYGDDLFMLMVFEKRCYTHCIVRHLTPKLQRMFFFEISIRRKGSFVMAAVVKASDNPSACHRLSAIKNDIVGSQIRISFLKSAI